jgi:hypothetical protein
MHTSRVSSDGVWGILLGGAETIKAAVGTRLSCPGVTCRMLQLWAARGMMALVANVITRLGALAGEGRPLATGGRRGPRNSRCRPAGRPPAAMVLHLRR